MMITYHDIIYNGQILQVAFRTAIKESEQLL